MDGANSLFGIPFPDPPERSTEETMEITMNSNDLLDIIFQALSVLFRFRFA